MRTAGTEVYDPVLGDDISPWLDNSAKLGDGASASGSLPASFGFNNDPRLSNVGTPSMMSPVERREGHVSSIVAPAAQNTAGLRTRRVSQSRRDESSPNDDPDAGR